MFLSTMNVVVSGSAAPTRTSLPLALSAAGAARGAGAEHAAAMRSVAPAPRSLHGAGDRVDLGTGPRRQPLITGIPPAQFRAITKSVSGTA